MNATLLKVLFFFSMCFLLSMVNGYSHETHDNQHIQVSLRMIGHQILLNAGDSTSRVLPIKNEKGKYRIQFESDFGFSPEELVSSIDEVFSKTELADGYILEVEECENNEVVYSYEIGKIEEKNIIPCGMREQPKSCYSLLFTLIGAADDQGRSEAAISNSSASLLPWSPMIYGSLLLLGSLIAGGIYFLSREKKSIDVDPSLIPLGEYMFDKRNTKLVFDEQSTELTSKEADLLFLLYNAVDTIVERDVMLQKVWGDEGDYVGRTVDVFISKLRKKLEFDSNIKIVNIRGVGYKLVLNG